MAAALVMAISAAAQGMGNDAAQAGPWTLRQCIEHAYSHSNVIRQQELTRAKSENDLSTAKGEMLPSVSAYASQSFNFGRGLNANNTYENRNTRNTSFGAQANWVIFQGMRRSNNIEMSRLDMEAATADLEAAKEDMGVRVASAYLQVLCAKEMAEAQREQAQLSEAQLARKEAMRDNGKASEADVAAARSLVAQDKTKSVRAENDYRLALLELTQLLELPSPEGFELSLPDSSALASELAGPEQVYQEAIGQKASIRAAKLKAESAEKMVSVAKSAYWPTLSMSAGVSTGYYGIAGMENPSFGDQMDQNMNTSIQFSLSIPIFNRFASRNNIRAAQMNQSSQQISLDDKHKALYKEVQTAYYNAVAAEATYASSQEAAASANEAFALAEAKYEEGLASSTDYAEARTNRITAIATLIQYKYELIFRTKILDFYRGIEIQ